MLSLAAAKGLKLDGPARKGICPSSNFHSRRDLCDVEFMLSLAALMGLKLKGNTWKVLCSSSCTVSWQETRLHCMALRGLQ